MAINNCRQYPWCTCPRAFVRELTHLARHCNASIEVHLVAARCRDPRPHKGNMFRPTTRSGSSTGHFTQQSSGKISARVASTCKLMIDTLPTADAQGTACTPKLNTRTSSTWFRHLLAKVCGQKGGTIAAGKLPTRSQDAITNARVHAQTSRCHNKPPTCHRLAVPWHGQRTT